MTKTSAINVNVPTDVKEEANALFNNLGLTMSGAINIFLKKALSEGGIPFEVRERKPSKRLLEALKESEDIINGKIKAKRYNDFDEMLEDIEDEI
jgi:DNA-damage-inducible protein J